MGFELVWKRMRTVEQVSLRTDEQVSTRTADERVRMRTA